MSEQTQATSQPKLDSYSRQKLGHAFMSLYDALVAEYQTQHMTLGTSWYKALDKIQKIVESKKSETQSYNYLMKFFNSHRNEYIRKMMTDKNKDSIITANAETTLAATARVKDEIKKFDDAVKSVAETEVLCVLKPVATRPANSFYDWVDKQPNEIVVDFEDPRSFERAYKKYILQQKYK